MRAMDNQVLSLERDSILKEIDVAFAGVTREGGISWSEAVALDNYGTDEECQEARAKDKDISWKELVTDPHWRPLPGVGGFSFLDAIGFRYYLPAAMIRTLEDQVKRSGPWGRFGSSMTRNVVASRDFSGSWPALTSTTRGSSVGIPKRPSFHQLPIGRIHIGFHEAGLTRLNRAGVRGLILLSARSIEKDGELPCDRSPPSPIRSSPPSVSNCSMKSRPYSPGSRAKAAFPGAKRTSSMMTEPTKSVLWLGQRIPIAAGLMSCVILTGILMHTNSRIWMRSASGTTWRPRWRGLCERSTAFDSIFTSSRQMMTYVRSNGFRYFHHGRTSVSRGL